MDLGQYEFITKNLSLLVNFRTEDEILSYINKNKFNITIDDLNVFRQIYCNKKFDENTLTHGQLDQVCGGAIHIFKFLNDDNRISYIAHRNSENFDGIVFVHSPDGSVKVVDMLNDKFQHLTQLHDNDRKALVESQLSLEEKSAIRQLSFNANDTSKDYAIFSACGGTNEKVQLGKAYRRSTILPDQISADILQKRANMVYLRTLIDMQEFARKHDLLENPTIPPNGSIDQNWLNQHRFLHQKNSDGTYHMLSDDAARFKALIAYNIHLNDQKEPASMGLNDHIFNDVKKLIFDENDPNNPINKNLAKTKSSCIKQDFVTLMDAVRLLYTINFHNLSEEEKKALPLKDKYQNLQKVLDLYNLEINLAENNSLSYENIILAATKQLSAKHFDDISQKDYLGNKFELYHSDYATSYNEDEIFKKPLSQHNYMLRSGSGEILNFGAPLDQLEMEITDTDPLLLALQKSAYQLLDYLNNCSRYTPKWIKEKHIQCYLQNIIDKLKQFQPDSQGNKTVDLSSEEGNEAPKESISKLFSDIFSMALDEKKLNENNTNFEQIASLINIIEARLNDEELIHLKKHNNPDSNVPYTIDAAAQFLYKHEQYTSALAEDLRKLRFYNNETDPTGSRRIDACARLMSAISIENINKYSWSDEHKRFIFETMTNIITSLDFELNSDTNYRAIRENLIGIIEGIIVNTSNENIKSKYRALKAKLQLGKLQKHSNTQNLFDLIETLSVLNDDSLSNLSDRFSFWYSFNNIIKNHYLLKRYIEKFKIADIKKIREKFKATNIENSQILKYLILYVQTKDEFYLQAFNLSINSKLDKPNPKFNNAAIKVTIPNNFLNEFFDRKHDNITDEFMALFNIDKDINVNNASRNIYYLSMAIHVLISYRKRIKQTENIDTTLAALITNLNTCFDSAKLTNSQRKKIFYQIVPEQLQNEYSSPKFSSTELGQSIHLVRINIDSTEELREGTYQLSRIFNPLCVDKDISLKKLIEKLSQRSQDSQDYIINSARAIEYIVGGASLDNILDFLNYVSESNDLKDQERKDAICDAIVRYVTNKFSKNSNPKLSSVFTLISERNNPKTSGKSAVGEATFTIVSDYLAPNTNEKEKIFLKYLLEILREFSINPEKNSPFYCKKHDIDPSLLLADRAVALARYYTAIRKEESVPNLEDLQAALRTIEQNEDENTFLSIFLKTLRTDENSKDLWESLDLNFLIHPEAEDGGSSTCTSDVYSANGELQLLYFVRWDDEKEEIPDILDTKNLGKAFFEAICSHYTKLDGSTSKIKLNGDFPKDKIQKLLEIDGTKLSDFITKFDSDKDFFDLFIKEFELNMQSLFFKFLMPFFVGRIMNLELLSNKFKPDSEAIQEAQVTYTEALNYLKTQLPEMFQNPTQIKQFLDCFEKEDQAIIRSYLGLEDEPTDEEAKTDSSPSLPPGFEPVSQPDDKAVKPASHRT